MNLVEISEMLKGAPDTFLTKHIKTPDGTVPQYLALAELQRRQDMRARFAQQAPQTTVADDATKGIAPEMPASMPAPMPAQMPEQAEGFKEGGPVGNREKRLEKLKKDMEEKRWSEYGPDFLQGPLDYLLKGIGWRATDRDKSLYNEYKRDVERMDAEVLNRYKDQGIKNAAVLKAARERQSIPPLSPPNENDIEIARQYKELMAGGPSPEVKAAREAADQKAFEEERAREMLEYFESTKPDSKGPTVQRKKEAFGDIYAGPFDTPEAEASHAEDLKAAMERARLKAKPGYYGGGMVKGYSGADGESSVKKRERDAIDEYLDYITKFEAPKGAKSRPIYRGEVLSSASGLYQMLDSTRRGIDKRLGLDPNDRSPETERLRAREYTKDTINVLEENNFPVTRGSMYGGHLLGQEGVIKFMKALKEDPLAGAQGFFDPKVIRINPGIFESRRNGELTSQTDKSLADIMAKLDKVGGAKKATGTSSEDENMGAAMAAATAADRGEVFAGEPVGRYEDMNLGIALKLAEMLKDSKLRKMSNMKSETPDFFYTPMSPGIGGYYRGGMVKGYSGADGKSDVEKEPLTYESDFQKALIFSSPELMEYYRRREQSAEEAQAEGRGFAEAAKSAINNPFSFLDRMKTNLNVAGAALKNMDRPAGPYGQNVSEIYPEAAKNFMSLGLERAAAQKELERAQAEEAARAASPTSSRNLEALANDFLKDIRESRVSKKDARDMALLQAGLGMMAGESPYFGVNVGRGAMAGLQSYQQQMAGNQALNSEAFRGIMAARGLGLDERRVNAAERAAAAEAKYREGMMEIQKTRIDALMKSAAVKNSGLAPAVAVQIIKGIQEAEINMGRFFTPQEFNEMFLKQAQGPLVTGTSSGNVGVDAQEE